MRVWPWQLGTVDAQVAHEPEDALDPVVVPARREGGGLHLVGVRVGVRGRIRVRVGGSVRFRVRLGMGIA